MVGAMPVNLIPKFCNGATDSCNGGEDGDLNRVRIGSRIRCNEDFGTVKYIGDVRGYKGVWYGVEWDSPSRGKHDGSVDDIQYFKTSKPGAGSFVRPNKIAPFMSCADAITKYYGDREDETVAAHRKTVINEWKREMGAPFIEMVGFEKIHQKQKFDRLLEVCVHDQNICFAGDVASLCPNVRSIDVSRNLFSNWREVVQLGAQLPDLRELDVSKNRMQIDLTNDALAQLSQHFANLEKLNISMCEYEWSDILKLSHLFPNVTEIIAAYNKVKRIEKFDKKMGNLTTLWLDGNPLDSWEDVSSLGTLRNLKVLSLNDCVLDEIRFDCGPNEKTDLFENLEVLLLNRNRIRDWRSVSELNKLKSLKKLYFLKNPIQDCDDYDTTSQLIIARIGTLQELNGSAITREARRGAEYDYMKKHGAEWKRAQNDPTLKALFDHEHCRFNQLVNKYGIPDDSLLENKPVNKTLTSQLLDITLRDDFGKILKKKIPSTMSVQKLATLAQRLFQKPGNTTPPKMYCLPQDEVTREILLDNNMKELNYFSVSNGDTIVVRF